MPFEIIGRISYTASRRVCVVLETTTRNELMSRSKTAHPTKFVQLVIERDPDSGLEVELEIRKDTVTGAMIGLDGSFFGLLSRIRG